MSRFKYTDDLPRKILTDTDLDAKFSDIIVGVASKFSIEQFRQRAIRYRHLIRPPNIFLRKELTGKAAIFAPALTLLGAWNWTNVELAHVQVSPNAKSGVETGHPVIHVHGSYKSHDWEPATYEICIGYSTNGGTTYTMWPYSNKFLGMRNAHVNPMYSGPTTHYHTGALASWWPYTMYGKPECHTSITALTQGGIDVTAITHWALGIRSNAAGGRSAGSVNPLFNGTKDIHALDVAKLWLVARDSV